MGFSRLTKLVFFQASYNHELSLDISLIQNFNGLLNLDLKSIKLNSNFPSFIGNFPNIHFISMASSVNGMHTLYISLYNIIVTVNLSVALISSFFLIQGLYGTMPSAILTLRKLQYLNIEQNSLSGSFPFASLQQLAKVNQLKKSLKTMKSTYNTSFYNMDI